jgi:hypothetical protein
MFGWEHNVLTGEITKVEYTPEQIEQAEKEGAKMEIKLQAEKAEAEARAVAKAAVLAQLGITEEQAKLLLS